MIVQIVTNATRMPTDGNGASAAERENGNATAITHSSVTCSGGAAAAVAGDLIALATGFWAEVTGPAVAGVLPIKEWKHCDRPPYHSGTGWVYPLPGNTTYRIFPASVLQGMRAGVRIKKAALEGIAGASCTINDLNGGAGTVILSLPVTTAGHGDPDYGEGVLIKGPFTVVCSNHAVVGSIEFQPAYS